MKLLGHTIVEVVADEIASRPTILSWLGHPENENQRSRAITAMGKWATHKSGRKIDGRRDQTTLSLIDSKLSQLERKVERSLRSGEIFRRQVFDMNPLLPSMFGNTSQTAFVRRLAFERRGEMEPYGSEYRDHWTKREPVLALAVGACLRLARRPTIEEMLFGSKDWALLAIQESERIRQEALAVGHPSAAKLIEFRHPVSF